MSAEALLVQCDTDMFPSELYCDIPWIAELLYGILLAAAFISTLKIMQISDAQVFSGELSLSTDQLSRSLTLSACVP